MAGEDLGEPEHGTVVRAGASPDVYADLAARFGASVPVEPLEAIAQRLTPPGTPAGTTDAYLAESRADRAG